ncbi:hypothetical protein D3C75_925640 [compost metagenome]
MRPVSTRLSWPTVALSYKTTRCDSRCGVNGMERLTSFITYSAALFLAWLGKLSPQDVAFLIGAAVGIGTFLVNWYYRRKSLEILKSIERDAAARRLFDELNR